MSEERMISWLMTFLLVAAIFALAGAGMMFVAASLTLLENGTVGESHPCPAGCSRVIEARVAARLDCADGRTVWQSKAGGKAGSVQRRVSNAHLNDGERHGSDVGDDDLILRDNTAVLSDRLDGGAWDFAKLLPAERSPGEVGGNCRDGGSDTGAERRESGATGHDPLGSRDFFHGAEYSKKPGEGEAERK